MTDEVKQGEPTATEPSPAPAAAPATEATPQAPVIVPEKLAGKSAEEIASQYLELEKKLGEQGRELGELRSRIPQQPQFQPPPPQFYPQQPIQPEPRIEFDYGKPEESVIRIVDHLVEKRLEAERQNRATHEVRQREQEAQVNYQSGRDTALKSNPRLFEGIEADVDQIMQTGYRQLGWHPAILRDPKAWERAAVNLRFDRGEYDRLAKPSIQPPQPSHTAVPNLAKSETKAGVELDDDTRKMAKEFGISEQEARDIIEKERDYSGGSR